MDETYTEGRRARNRAAVNKYAANNRDKVNACRNRYRNRNREHVLRIKAGTPCADCGQKFPPVCMDFDHLDDGDKDASISKLVNACVSLAKIDAEIAKCELVCANCHRLRTARRGQYGTTLTEESAALAAMAINGI